jgi:signal transduction histidine kinase
MKKFNPIKKKFEEFTNENILKYKKLRNRLYILYLISWILINYFLFSEENFQVLKLLLNGDLKIIIINMIIIASIFINIITINKILKSVNDFSITIKDFAIINENKTLESKIIQNIAENIHHELKSPMLSVKYVLKEYQNIFETLKNLADPNIKNNFDRIFYSALNCENCKLYNKNNPACRFRKKNNKNLDLYLEELKNIAQFSLKNMFSTIQITKSLKSLKMARNLSVYETIEYSIRIYKMVQKYNFKFEIDKSFEKCFLNGLNPDLLTNILLNHIKNSLEAGATIIKFIFDEYFYDKDKNHDFISFYIIDNGKGIPKHIVPYIYELNVSSKGSKNNESSRGFGLYISKSILQFYDGDEELQYTSVKGTIFKLTIPVKHCSFKKN